MSTTDYNSRPLIPRQLSSFTTPLIPLLLPPRPNLMSSRQPAPRFPRRGSRRWARLDGFSLPGRAAPDREAGCGYSRSRDRALTSLSIPARKPGPATDAHRPADRYLHQLVVIVDCSRVEWTKKIWEGRVIVCTMWCSEVKSVLRDFVRGFQLKTYVCKSLGC